MTTTKAEHWDCHAHRDELRVSDHGTVYRPEHGQLCWWQVHWDCVLFYPIVFKSKFAAGQWIERGYIGELQESWSILQIGFSNVAFQMRDRD